MSETVSNRPSFEKSVDRQILAALLVRRLITDKAEVVGYSEMSLAIGRSVQKVRGILAGARKDVEAEHCVLLATVRGAGLSMTRRYSGVLYDTSQSIRRKSQRAITKTLRAASADEDISNDERIAMNTEVSVLGVIALCTGRQSLKRLETKVAANQANQLPTAETLKFFSE